MKFAMDVYIRKNSTHIYLRGKLEGITSFTLLPFQALGKATDCVNRAEDLNGVQITMFYTRSFIHETVALQPGKYRFIEFTYIVLGIKYTHSGVMASAIAMNKAMSKHIFRSLGIDTPKGYINSRENVLKNNVRIDYPYILKPINEGSSIGVHVFFSHEDYLKLKNMFAVISAPDAGIQKKSKWIPVPATWMTKGYSRDLMIIEEYIPGVELHTAVLLDEAIGTMEIRPKNKFYDYEAKYTGGLTYFELLFFRQAQNWRFNCGFKIHILTY